MYTLGIDIGSTTSKCVLLKDGTVVAATSLILSGTGTEGPSLAYEQLLEKAGIKEDEIDFVMATGYGRTTFDRADAELSELSAHAKGVHFRHPDLHLGFHSPRQIKSQNHICFSKPYYFSSLSIFIFFIKAPFFLLLLFYRIKYSI